MRVLKFLRDWGKAKPLPSPFQGKAKEAVMEMTTNELDDDQKVYVEMTWGKEDIIGKVIEDKETDAISWSIQEQGRNRLKPVDLDDLDLSYIRRWNAMPENEKKQLVVNTYKQMKPYILTEGWTYAEIGQVLNYSESTVQRYGPRIKDVQRMRQQKKGKPLPRPIGV